MINIKEIECPVCRSRRIIYSKHTGEYICKSCGYITRDRELKYYKPYSKGDRKDKYVFPSKKRYEYRRSYKENLIEEVKDIIEQYAFLLSLPPSDVTLAQMLIPKVIYKGRWNKEYLSLALLYISNRYNGLEKRPLKEFLRIEGISPKKLRKTVKQIIKTASIALRYKVDEREIFSKFYERYGYNVKVDELIDRLYETIKRNGIARRKSSKTLYTSIAYLSYKLLMPEMNPNDRKNVTLRNVTKLTGVSEVPIRNTVKEILTNINIEIGI